MSGSGSCFLGFDIGGTKIACGLLNEEYAVVDKLSCTFEPLGEDGIAQSMLELAKKLCAKAGIGLDSIRAVGVCIPGSVDTERGIVIDAYNLSLHDSYFRVAVENRFQIKTALLNDADAAALAEARLGALSSVKNSMLVTIGTGIGVGIILDGKLFHGGRGLGVEAGHAVMDIHGDECTCGRCGCVETLCSASWLLKKAKSALGQDASIPMLVDLAKAGEPACAAIWNEFAFNLGNALASYVNILDPETIALGGGVSGVGEFLLSSIRDHVDKGSFFRPQTPVVIAALGNDAGLAGACIYADEQQRNYEQ